MKLFLASVLLFSVGCGGKVAVDGEAPGQGGAGSTANSTVGASVTVSNASVATVSTGSGPGTCTTHGDCPRGVCIFATGTCANDCDSDACDPCEVGTVCDGCATSSCPDCLDCRPACVPAVGRCDDNETCPPGTVCVYALQYCAPMCNANGGCPTMFEYCDGCPSGSCCGCDDCVPACIGGE